MSASFISKRVACDGKLDFRARACRVLTP